jgi:hypothetical protein
MSTLTLCTQLDTQTLNLNYKWILSISFKIEKIFVLDSKTPIFFSMKIDHVMECKG